MTEMKPSEEHSCFQCTVLKFLIGTIVVFAFIDSPVLLTAVVINELGRRWRR
jgi:hypothetical protein